ncbi:MAG: hypothetical protein CR986_03110 [Ignavibacteriae bacterium]|nr:MAG: hypothetical protein CR986_03110 [Ignavibacteriota bacterium]
MQIVWDTKGNTEWIFSNSLVNRLNFSWYLNNNITFKTSLRNIFDYGQFVSLIPFYSQIVTQDCGYLDLTEEITSGNSYVLFSNIDRLNFTYSNNNLEIIIGRQRVNWGINMVWTPNDIFNSASFINFNYAEKQGSDAVNLQYYLDYASSIALVAKLDCKKKLTFAGKYQFNKWDYDFQIISGFSDIDYIFGFGWTGNISGAGFSGELTYFRDKENFAEATGIALFSIGSNYTFSNGLLVAAEFLYNSNGTTDYSIFQKNIFSFEYSAKTLSPSKYSIFLQGQYPITPLTSVSLATIINPSDGSLFINPGLDISLSQDVYLLFTEQIFLGDNFTEWGDYGKFYYLRLKWNF